MIKFGQRKNDTDRIRREAVVFLKQSFPLPAQAPAPRSRIYRALYDAQDFCSRQTLARECGLSLPTVHQYLTELFQAGLVRYSGEERATGGRKAQGIEIVPDARIALGISVTGRYLRLAAVDLRLRELAYAREDFDLTAHLNLFDGALAGIIEKFLDDFHLDRSRLLGVGITIPGLISPDGQRITSAPTLGIRDAPLYAITRGIDYPVHVENDGTASGHAESIFHRKKESMAYLSLEYGIGGAVLIDSVPYPGTNAKSGEFGHICVEPGGLRCSCGCHGCLEAYCSANRIESGFGVSLDEFFRGAREHDPAYEALLFDMLRHLAIGINSIHMVLDCDVVLGGFLSEYLQPWLPVLKQYVTAGNPFTENADFVQLSTLRRHITSHGAALFFVREFVTGI